MSSTLDGEKQCLGSGRKGGLCVVVMKAKDMRMLRGSSDEGCWSQGY